MNRMEQGLRDLAAVDKGPWILDFGDDADSWNIDDEEADGDGSGLPGRRLITEALHGLANCWGDYDAPTAARAFNLPLELIGRCTIDGPFESDPDDVHPNDLATLVSVLVGCRSHGGTTSVATTAKITNQHPVRVIEAVAHHPYAFLSGDRDDFEQLFIELDGE